MNTSYTFWLKIGCISMLMALMASCGGGRAASSAVTTSDNTTPTPSAITATQLKTFWGRYGSSSNFSPMYVEVVTQLLEAEDKVVAKDYQGAKLITDALMAKYPLAGDVWWSILQARGPNGSHPHLGEPGAYAHLRMIDEIVQIGVKKPLPGTKSIQLTVAIPACSDIVVADGPTMLNHRLSPEIEANDFEVVRQSLRLFQSYILAITGGELRLEVKMYKIPDCFQMKKETGYAVGNYDAPIYRLPPGVAEQSDMFWVLYPSDYDVPALKIAQGGGMGGFNGKPVFISEDDWVIKKAADQGSGIRTEVERRIYLPEWVQHEFFHHLYGAWPGFGLEVKDHQWFDRSTWPEGFVGSHEEDYYSETLRKRFYTATPSLAQGLKKSL
jgi:hypothetical protein